MGGEPLLHKQINSIIDELCKIDNLLFVDMATNGTIVPNAATMDAIKNNGVCLEVSDYGENSWKMKELNEACDQRGVLRFHQKFEYWTKAEIVRKHERSEAELNAHFVNCITSPGVTNHIINGTLYRCLYSGMASRLSLAPIAEDDYVNLNFAPNSLTSEKIDAVNKLTYRSSPLLTCSHCNNGKTKVEPGLQLIQKYTK
jgi:molybdenum cofactor biosynthesis enzyme MoaA